MKKRKWRVLAIFGGVVALVAFVAVFFASREHPDYVRAAKLLPAARQEAEAMFGPLTWEEYRLENGISGEADLEEWTKVANSIPTSVSNQWSDPTGHFPPSAEVFQRERAWFEKIESLAVGLRSRHIPDPTIEWWQSLYLGESKQIIRACTVGIVGAADSGDTDAILKIGRAANQIIEELLVESDVLQLLVAGANKIILSKALIRAAVRNTHDQEVLDCVRQVLSQMPPMPPIREVMGGELRFVQGELAGLWDLEPEQVDEWLDEHVGNPLDKYPQSPFVQKAIEMLQRVSRQEAKQKRGTGPHTVDALEARWLERMVASTLLMEKIVQNDIGSRARLEHLTEATLNSTDRAAEVAFFGATSLVITDGHLSHLFYDEVAIAAFEMIDRYPEFANLPSLFPLDVSFADPFGGGPILYQKTSTGFVIYSRYSNYLDDGFYARYPGQLEKEAAFGWSHDGLDVGLIVSYDPGDPIP